MAHTLRVENLRQETTADDLLRLFGSFGDVRGVQFVPESGGHGNARIGLVEMTSDIQARRAVAALDDERFQGRVLAVRPVDRCAHVARSRRDRSNRWNPFVALAGPRPGDFGDRSGSAKNE